MLSTLMALAATAAVQSEPTPAWQDDPHDPWVIGPWKLSCGRDGDIVAIVKGSDGLKDLNRPDA